MIEIELACYPDPMPIFFLLCLFSLAHADVETCVGHSECVIGCSAGKPACLKEGWGEAGSKCEAPPAGQSCACEVDAHCAFMSAARKKEVTAIKEGKQPEWLALQKKAEFKAFLTEARACAESEKFPSCFARFLADDASLSLFVESELVQKTGAAEWKKGAEQYRANVKAAVESCLGNAGWVDKDGVQLGTNDNGAINCRLKESAGKWRLVSLEQPGC